jgi:peptidoglycan/xylan/chitin deacetylase (PgdA/CDA1 family)
MAPIDKCEARDSAAAAQMADKYLLESSSVRGVDPDSPHPLILTYHEVWPKSSAYLYSVTTSQLEAHLQLIQAIRNSDSSKVRVPRVTFDDGHISTHQHALGLLEKYSLPAIFFVTVGFVEARQEIMGWAQLRDLVSQGHEVQSHGWSHAHLTKCTDAELANELERPKRTLEDGLGVAVDALSFPGGRWNARVLEACARIGYRRVYASQPCLQRRREGVELRGRLMVRRTTEVRHLEELFRGSSFAMLRLRARNALGETAKFLFGDRAYLRLWRILARKSER